MKIANDRKLAKKCICWDSHAIKSTGCPLIFEEEKVLWVEEESLLFVAGPPLPVPLNKTRQKKYLKHEVAFVA